MTRRFQRQTFVWREPSTLQNRNQWKFPQNGCEFAVIAILPPTGSLINLKIFTSAFTVSFQSVQAKRYSSFVNRVQCSATHLYTLKDKFKSAFSCDREVYFDARRHCGSLHTTGRPPAISFCRYSHHCNHFYENNTLLYIRGTEHRLFDFRSFSKAFAEVRCHQRLFCRQWESE